MKQEEMRRNKKKLKETKRNKNKQKGTRKDYEKREEIGEEKKTIRNRKKQDETGNKSLESLWNVPSQSMQWL